MRADVVVIGGGPAGSAAAIGLARRGARVVVAHAAAHTTVNAGETLPPAARPLLRDLGLWPSVTSGGHRPAFANESAWGSDSIGRTDFTRDPNGHGWHVDRCLLDRSWREVARRAGARVMDGTRVATLARCRGEWHIGLHANESAHGVRARWVIDCTGRNSVIATHLGLRRSRDDRLVASVATLARRGETPDEGCDSVTFVESTPDGWWFTVEAPAGRRILIYFTDFSEPSARAATSRSGFTALWHRTPHLRERVPLSSWAIESGPTLKPAGSTRLCQPAGIGWLAAGDALMALDPISSQGLLTAVYTGYRAAEAVDASHGDTADAGAQYAERTREIYRAYRDARYRCYADERRWPAHRFWQARHSELPSPGATI